MQRIPPEPTGFVVPSARDLAALGGDLARERAWYGDAPRYQTDADIKQAEMAAELFPIPKNHYLQPIYRFRNNTVPEGTHALLSRRAFVGTLLVGHLWYQGLQRLGIDADYYRLALTSMTRSQEYQDSLVADGHLAVDDSTHQTGNTFDVDVSAYMLMTSEGLVSIVHPDRHEVGSESALFYAENRRLYGDYDPRITDMAVRVTQQLHDQGLINFVPEFADQSQNRVMHISVGPNITGALH